MGVILGSPHNVERGSPRLAAETPHLKKNEFGIERVGDGCAMRLFQALQASLSASGALGRIRTSDPRNRNPMLYPAELRARRGLD
jgi:hypothetical protein